MIQTLSAITYAQNNRWIPSFCNKYKHHKLRIDPGYYKRSGTRHEQQPNACSPQRGLFALGAVSPASLSRKQKPEDRRKSEDDVLDAPKAKTPTKKDVATASPRAREKTPLLPK